MFHENLLKSILVILFTDRQTSSHFNQKTSSMLHTCDRRRGGSTVLKVGDKFFAPTFWPVGGQNIA